MQERNTPPMGQYTWQDLTEKEQTVLTLAVKNMPRNEIAKAVGSAKSSIDKMLSNEEGARSLYNKIGVTNFPQAVNWYYTNVSQLPPPLPRPLAAHYAPWLYTVLFFAHMLYMWFIPVWFVHPIENNWYDLTGIYFLSPLLAGLYGLVVCYQLRRQAERSWLYTMGLLFAGLVLWAIGQAIWVGYNLAGVDQPYPSLPDYSFVPGCLLWLVGILRLSYRYPRTKAAGHGITGVLALLLFGNALVLLLLVASNEEFRLMKDPVKFALDLYYPATSAISLAFFIELSYRALYTDLKQTTQRAIYCLFLGAVIWFVSDTGFSITTAVPDDHWLSFQNGDWVDFGFSLAFWLTGLGLLQLVAEQQAKSDDQGWENQEIFKEVD